MKKKNPQKTKLPLYKSATFDYNILTFSFSSDTKLECEQLN